MPDLAWIIALLKKPIAVYIGIFLTVIVIFALPVSVQDYLGLTTTILAPKFKGWVAGFGMLSFFLWLGFLLVKLSAFVKSYFKNKKEKAESDRYYDEYMALPAASRFIIGLLIERDRRYFYMPLGAPGTQELMDTQWFTYSSNRFDVQPWHWSGLKNFRKRSARTSSF